MLERLRIFIFKVLVWLFFGAVIGSFFAQIHGLMPIWFLIVYLFGTILLFMVFSAIYIRYIDVKVSRISEMGQEPEVGRGCPARIEKISDGGLRMVESSDLKIFELTVFPKNREPYQTSIHQYILEGDLDMFDPSKLVTFYEDEHNQGYGTISFHPPETNSPISYNPIGEEKIYPGRHKMTHLFARNPNWFTRKLNVGLIIVIFSLGFLSPFVLTGNFDWLRFRITYFPQKLIFQDKGNFNPEIFERAYYKAIDYIGDRRIESLLFYKEFTDIRIEDSKRSGYFGNVTIRGDSDGRRFMVYEAHDMERVFTADSIRYELFKKALDDAATDHKLENILYIGVRKGIRWGTRDGRIPPDYKQDHIDIHIVFKGGKKSLSYSGKTGERLPE